MGCFHSYYENISANCQPNVMLLYHDPCYSHCPSCDGNQEIILKCISQPGMCKFIADTMITNAIEQHTPLELANKLYDYPNSGVNIYKKQRTTSSKPEKRHTSMTI